MVVNTIVAINNNMGTFVNFRICERWFTGQMFDNNVYTNRLNLLYGESGLTQEKFAKICGVSSSAMKNYLKGERPLHLDNIYALCTYFSVSADWLLGITDTRSIEKDVQLATKTIGLSEKAVNKIINADELGSLRNDLSHMIEQDGMKNLLEWYSVYLALIDKLNHNLNESEQSFNLNEEFGTITLSEKLSIQYAQKIVSDNMASICENEQIIPYMIVDETGKIRFPREEAIEAEKKERRDN